MKELEKLDNSKMGEIEEEMAKLYGKEQMIEERMEEREESEESRV